ncbi:ABC transporter permease subunit [Glycomyces sp. L485]|uniref:ABC transporter permease subunit n=1 Tax=Glycomyces sp. L485 TaxID=2909235 RepID=UPI001F4A9A2B|nr:ABC transporter permease subunit [Glycomyces sp. L485]MCH7231945.1 ABC transporter permease subunit [Glycomyces sp. L485]
MNLFKAELHRIARRRLSLIFGICAVAGLLALTVIMWFNSSTGPSEADLAFAQSQADEVNARYEACADDEQFFEGHPEYGWVADDEWFKDMPHEQACSEVFWADARAEDFIYVYTFKFHEEGVVLLIGVGIVTGLLAMLLAASTIGAEWSSGGIANLLVWHPNRMRVWSAKLGAVVTVCALAVVAMLALAFGLLYLTAAVRGDTGTLDAPWWGDTSERLTRTGVLALGMTVLGSALAMLGRHTAIAGGVIVGYLTVGEMLVTFVRLGIDMRFPELLSVYTWIGAWIEGRVTLEHWNGLSELPETMVLTATDAGLLLGGIVLLFTALGTWSFAKRDIT